MGDDGIEVDLVEELSRSSPSPAEEALRRRAAAEISLLRERIKELQEHSARLMATANAHQAEVTELQQQVADLRHALDVAATPPSDSNHPPRFNRFGWRSNDGQFVLFKHWLGSVADAQAAYQSQRIELLRMQRQVETAHVPEWERQIAEAHGRSEKAGS